MNVALLIESLAGGGSERVVQRLSLGLAQRGHRVFVYCLRSALVSVEQMAAGGVTVREAHSVGHDPLLAWRLARWLLHDRIEVVHAHSCAALAWAFPAAKLLGLPILHVWHGWPLNKPTRYHQLAERLDRFADRVGINSESLRSRLPPGRAAQTAAYLPNGIDLPATAPPKARARLDALCGRALAGPSVLAVGNLRAEKDAHNMLAAFALLRREQPRAQLVWLGAVRDDIYAQSVRQAVQILNLQDNTHFPGPCPDAWQLMAGADVFCLSSRTESMPNVVLEAMSQQLPIVATTVGDVGRLGTNDDARPGLLRHGESGLLAPPNDPEALAAALAYALRDPAAARRRAARAYAEYRCRFTLDQMVRRYERVYADLQRKRRPQRSACPPARRLRSVLMLGPAPPQIGGMATSINLLLKSPLCERYRLLRFATTTSTPGVATSANWLHRLARLATSALRHTRALGRLATSLLVNRIDLLHIHTCSYVTFYRNLADIALAKLLGRKVILHIRGGQFARFCQNAGPGQQWLIRRGLSAADAVLVLSDCWRAALQTFTGRTPVHVVPSAVELGDLPERGSRAGQPCRFLYLAALTHAKGLANLLAAATELRAADVAFELLIAGPATEEPQATWVARVEAAGLAHCTRFFGPATGADKTHLLATADCFVHPSHSEALPNAVLEAAAAGLPVIATAVGSLPDLMLANGRAGPLSPLVPPHDPHALAREMQRLARDPALRHRISDDLLRHVKANYSLPCVAKRLAEVYECVFTPSRTRRLMRHENAEQSPLVAESALRPNSGVGVDPAPTLAAVRQNAGAP